MADLVPHDEREWTLSFEEEYVDDLELPTVWVTPGDEGPEGFPVKVVAKSRLSVCEERVAALTRERDEAQGFYDWRCPDCGGGVTKIHVSSGGMRPCGQEWGYWTPAALKARAALTAIAETPFRSKYEMMRIAREALVEETPK